MPHRRRAPQRGQAFFFTVMTHDRRPILATPEAVRCLQSAWRTTQADRPFRTVAAVILPDHLHCVWQLPPGDTDVEGRWRLIKSRFTKAFLLLPASGKGCRCKTGRRMIWQPESIQKALRDRRDLRRHVDLIHFDPIHHGHAARAAEWPFSTFLRFANRGHYEPDWPDGALPLLEDVHGQES
jgi:putative transposase